MDLGGGSWAGFFASIDCLEDVCGDIDDTLLEALNPSGSCAPREDQAHLLAMGGFSPNQSFRLDDPFFGFQDAPGDDEVLNAINQAPPKIAGPPAIFQPMAQVTTDGEGMCATVPDAAPDLLHSSDQPTNTVQDSRPVVPKTRGLRTSTATFSVSPSLGNMDTDAMKIFIRFYSLHELKIKERMTNRLQTGYTPREDGPIAITIKEVKLDRKIKRILLSSKAEAHMTELRNEHLLKSARGSKSYFIGHNGFWIMRQSRLRTSG
ncbi:g1072 [Coccomyxa elongata]